MMLLCLVCSVIIERKIPYASFGKRTSKSNQMLDELLVSHFGTYMLFEMNIVHYPRCITNYPYLHLVVKFVLKL
jgi:hypothetical protein